MDEMPRRWDNTPMSISRLRKSRGLPVRQAGFSIVAAFVFAALLTVAAVAVQSAIPPTSTSLSQTEEANTQVAAIAAVLPESQVATPPDIVSTAPGTKYGQVVAEAGKKGTYNQVCEPGMDYTVFYDSKGQVDTKVSQGRRRCVPGDSVKTKTEKAYGWEEDQDFAAFMATSPKRGDVEGVFRDETYETLMSEKGPRGNLKSENRECKIDEATKGKPTERWASANIKWKCLVRVCIPTQKKTANSETNCDLYAVAQGSVPQDKLFKFQADWTATQSVDGYADAAQAEKDRLNVLNQYGLKADTNFDRIRDSFNEDQAELDGGRKELDEKYNENQAALKRLADAEEALVGCGKNDSDCKKDAKAEIVKAQKEASLAEKALNDQLKELGLNAVTLKPEDDPSKPPASCPPGEKVDANGNCPSTGKPPVSTAPPGSQPPGSQPPGSGLPGGFGNPGLGANNQPQSPFGGTCNTRYVCSGNTLYYQSANQYGGSTGQCMTQPVQQCQYGCQQMNTGAANGQSSTMSEIGTGLQVMSTIMRMFGGGGGNTGSTLTNNLPSSCATQQQQQQQQSPYGSGTNGQPCSQPPQQPDAAQCTSGSWKPTSGQQNGCTTGWQCVPNGTTGSDTKPTAQLSCQPQITDVGQPISFSFACGNSSGSTGTGFSTGGAVSGSATTPAPAPPSGQNIATYTLTCINQGITTSAQCQVQLNKPGIVLVTNPKKVPSGEISLIGWVTAGMKSCVISSPDQQDFTSRNSGNTSANGAATTSPITAETRFQLDCQTIAGGTKTATTTVSVN